MRGVVVLAAGVCVVVAGCSEGGGAPGARASSSGVATPGVTLAPTAVATPSPTPVPPPAYAVAALRERATSGVAAGTVSVGALLRSGTGFRVYRVTWSSQGGVMTGTLHLPAGAGPFPVVVVNHGYVPVSQYYVGQDSSKYADALAAAGFLCVSPNYPGYAGSSPAMGGVPSLVAEAISDIDLISSLHSLPAADPARVAVAGHSNGGGVALMLLAADPRVRAVVLYAPVSSDMADNARKWWTRSPGGTGGLPSPDVDPQAYALMSPRNHLPAGGPPTLVMQGSADEQIPAAWTSATVAALQAAGIRTRFVSFPGALHNFIGADLTRANGLAVDWIKQAFA